MFSSLSIAVSLQKKKIEILTINDNAIQIETSDGKIKFDVQIGMMTVQSNNNI